MMTKEDVIENWQIQPVSVDLKQEIKKNWDNVAKPLDSMGKFEGMICQLGAILHTPFPTISKRAMLICCGDNGIVEEGVTQSGQEVTTKVALGLGKNDTSVGKIAEYVKADVFTLDLGINTDMNLPGVIDRKIAHGTNNFLKEPAMSAKQTTQAIFEGMKLVKECKEKGYQILGTGEMGIGNTTTSTAITCALLNQDPYVITGRGAGLDDSGLLRKQKVIAQALQQYDLYHKDPFTVLSTVGGYDIAGLTGIFLGGARYEVPVVCDGVISLAAALVADRIKPGCREYMIASHGSMEPASALLLEALELSPVLDAKMALGEGTGACMMFSLIDMALCVYHQNRTFADIKMEAYQRF